MDWSLVPVTDADMDELMTWFPDAAAVDIWSGPKFRYPFTRETFREDCRWDDFPSFRLQDPAGAFAAFGQVNERHDRVHFARLVVNPSGRGQGIGRRLIRHLIEEGRSRFDHAECGLFVYRRNVQALRCYEGAGFRITDYPDDAPMADECYYLKRTMTI